MLESNDLSYNSEAFRKRVRRVERTINDRLAIVEFIADVVSLNYTSTTGFDLLFPPSSAITPIPTTFSAVITPSVLISGGNVTNWAIDLTNLTFEYIGNKETTVDVFSHMVYRPNTSINTNVVYALYGKQISDLDFIQIAPETRAISSPDSINQLMSTDMQTYTQLTVTPGMKFQVRPYTTHNVSLSFKVFDFVFNVRPIDVTGSN